MARSTPLRLSTAMIAAVTFFSFFIQCTAAFSPLPLLRTESPAVQRLASRADKEPTLRILRPRSGDIVIAEDYKQTFDITWVNNTLDFNASISLRQGPPGLGDLPKVATINASTINNGTYTWSARSDDFLKGLGSGDNPASGCNYSIEISAGGQRALSEYFTIQNDDDGGLNTTVQCPSGVPEITGGNAATNAGSGGSAGGAGGGKKGGKFSAAAMGGAVAGAAIGCLALGFALGWFVARKWGKRGRGGGYEAATGGETVENAVGEGNEGKGAVTVEENRVVNGDDEINEYMRLYRKYGDAQMMAGNQVYQMPGNRDGS